MNETSQSRFKNSLWKVADQSRITGEEHSRMHPAYQIPQRFSPSKSKQKEKGLFSSSIQKPRSPRKIVAPATPKSQVRIPAPFTNQNSFSMQQILLSPVVSPSTARRPLEKQETDSLKRLSEEQLKQIKEENKKELLQEYMQNRKIIQQLKTEFQAFKQRIIDEIAEQKTIISSIWQELKEKVNQQHLQKPEKLLESLEEINRIETEIKGDVSIQQIQPSEEIVETSTARKPVREKPNLEKCSQIVSTINILSEINDSPVERPKSVQKRSFQQYKQKVLATVKSNEKLYSKQPYSSDRKVTSFKLEKFKNAIQKLKEQVNQIRQLGDIRPIKSGRLLRGV